MKTNRRSPEIAPILSELFRRGEFTRKKLAKELMGHHEEGFAACVDRIASSWWPYEQPAERVTTATKALEECQN